MTDRDSTLAVATEPQSGAKSRSRDRDGEHSEEALQSFLRVHGMSGDGVRKILSDRSVNSLHDLKNLLGQPTVLASVIEQLADYPLALMSLDSLTPGIVDNAIYLARSPEADAQVVELRSFLSDRDVLTDSGQWDALFVILREATVTSLKRLREVKGDQAYASKLKTLTDKIQNWDADAGAKFAAVTVTQVAVAGRQGGESVATPELQAFLRKNGMPPAAEAELVEFGITTLEQLKDVTEDKATGGKLDRLKTRLEQSGIHGATKQLEKVRSGDLDREIAGARSATTKESGQKSADLGKAIADIQTLRERLVKASGTELAAVTSDVERRHRAIISALHGISLTNMEAADAAAGTTADSLDAMLRATLANATAAKATLDSIDTAAVPLAKMITEQYLLCGYLITPGGLDRMSPELVRMPDDPDRLKHGRGSESMRTHKYKGSQTRSFAVAAAEHASSSFAATAEASGGAFVGSGVAAVSAAASYADAKQKSTEDENFQSSTQAECGEFLFSYIPRRSLEFDEANLHLSERAIDKLKGIAAKPAGSRDPAIKAFLRDFGSHFFLHNVLGGRYRLHAHGKASTSTAKGLLVSAVSQTTNWAASAAGSYAGLGGAAKAAASVEGKKSVDSASGNRYGLTFDNASVDVSIDARGGRGTGPRDVWEQTLQFESTWEVIDRDQPRGLWQLLDNDTTLSSEIKDLAPDLERVWVREIYLPSIQNSDPALHAYVAKTASIATSEALYVAIQDYRRQPPLEIVVTLSTSGRTSHPKAIASPDRDGLKLIGGGAHVDYGSGYGSLLTGSYPMDESWVASAKDHVESSPSTITAYAIYLYDPYDIWEVTRVPAKSDGSSNRPRATAELPAGFALTGGGGRVDFAGPGMLLTACGPTEDGPPSRSWTVKAKDHLQGDAGTAFAWVFGLRLRSGEKPTPSGIQPRLAQSNHPAAEFTVGAKADVIVGGGAAVTWTGPEGGALTSTGFGGDPRKQTWQARAKDHLKYADLDLTMWAITRPGSMLTP